jgi:hypothetical protein
MSDDREPAGTQGSAVAAARLAVLAAAESETKRVALAALSDRDESRTDS